jgi:hypothetical protein
MSHGDLPKSLSNEETVESGGRAATSSGFRVRAVIESGSAPPTMNTTTSTDLALEAPMRRTRMLRKLLKKLLGMILTRTLRTVFRSVLVKLFRKLLMRNLRRLLRRFLRSHDDQNTNKEAHARTRMVLQRWPPSRLAPSGLLLKLDTFVTEMPSELAWSNLKLVC